MAAVNFIGLRAPVLRVRCNVLDGDSGVRGIPLPIGSWGQLVLNPKVRGTVLPSKFDSKRLTAKFVSIKELRPRSESLLRPEFALIFTLFLFYAQVCVSLCL